MWRSLVHVHELDNLMYRGGPKKTIYKRSRDPSKLPDTRPTPTKGPTPMEIDHPYNTRKRSLETVCNNSSTSPQFRDAYCKIQRVSPPVESRKRPPTSDLVNAPKRIATAKEVKKEARKPKDALTDLPGAKKSNNSSSPMSKCYDCLDNNGWERSRVASDVTKSWCTQNNKCLKGNPTQVRSLCKDATIIVNKAQCKNLFY